MRVVAIASLIAVGVVSVAVPQLGTCIQLKCYTITDNTAPGSLTIGSDGLPTVSGAIPGLGSGIAGFSSGIPFATGGGDATGKLIAHSESC